MVEVVLLVVGMYALIGLLFAIAFVMKGVGRVDPAASGAPWGFRLVILPGVAAMWPMMLARWVRAREGGRDDA